MIKYPIFSSLYFKSIEKNGGQTYHIYFDSDPQEVCNKIDGLIIPGGKDMDPANYGQERHPLTSSEPLCSLRFNLEKKLY